MAAPVRHDGQDGLAEVPAGHLPVVRALQLPRVQPEVVLRAQRGRQLARASVKVRALRRRACSAMSFFKRHRDAGG